MSGSESIKKMLRSVLQTSKDGVSVNRLQSEYRSLCGEVIPHKQLGYPTLEAYLQSIPTVARLDFRTGELKCYAVVCEKTAHIAELVARQKTSKKCSQVVDRMRFKTNSNYNMFDVRPRSTLRQPSGGGPSQQYSGSRGPSASWDNRTKTFFHNNIPKPAARCSAPAPVSKTKPPQAQPIIYDVKQDQCRVSQLLAKYSSGLWLSKLPGVYQEMFHRQLHPQAVLELEKWTHICSVEQPSSNNRADRLVYPPVPPKPSLVNPPPTPKPIITPTSSLAKPDTLRLALRSTSFTPLASRCSDDPNGKPRPPPTTDPFSLPRVNIKPSLPTTTIPTFNSPPSTPTCLDPAPTPPLPSSPSVLPVSADVRAKLKELLSKYTCGLWAHAVPQLFMETYKTPFPEHVLADLSSLADICMLEYPMPGNKKAILYSSSLADLGSTTGEEAWSDPAPPSVLASVVPPSLELPQEQYPSVLVTDVKNSNTVTVRFIGEGYSKAHEAMEKSMCSFYSPSSTFQPLLIPVIGQLAAVRVEGGDEVVRAQVMELTSDKVKVYYVDDGYTGETNKTWLLELHQDFLTLPFQATNVRLAGLDAFVSHPSVLSTLESLTVGKILLMETVEPGHQKETGPLVVLYDTSQDDDVNVNVACLRALQDSTMDNSLTVNSIYQDVCVTAVCPDGLLYCQLPSRGTLELNKLLDKIETFFISQVTSESLVSRPFCGKLCLTRYKGKWSRVEITNLHSSRVMDVQFIDLGVLSSVEVIQLREIPPPLLRDLTAIPPQAIKCCLSDLVAPAEGWKSETVLWLKEAIMHIKDCSMKIIKLDQIKEERLAHILLFSGADSQQEDCSINHQLPQSSLWQRLTEPNNNTITLPEPNNNTITLPKSKVGDHLDAVDLSALMENLSLKSLAVNPPLQQPLNDGDGDTAGEKPQLMPPLLVLPLPGQNMDVYVPVACHPGHFVLQPWQDLFKLVIMTGEMILYYNKTEGIAAATDIQVDELYAAKVDKYWHRVLVKAILSNGLVSIYELDYGKHELVSSAHLRPLIDEFRQLPVQAITAQLAGVEQQQWSVEASMVFRNHVEERPLVALMKSVEDRSESGVKCRAWERKVTVHLVDTSQDKDVWIHNIVANVVDGCKTDSLLLPARLCL